MCLPRHRWTSWLHRSTWRVSVLVLLLAPVGCGQGSVGHEPVSLCVPEGACDEAMFQGGLKGAPANPEAGEALYVASCASCHGPGGKGTDKTPRVNFTDPVWHARFEDGEMADIILKGRAPTMPAFSLNEGQLRDVVSHIRSLKVGTAPPPPPPESQPGY